MIKISTSVRERMDSFSKEKEQLLRLLLEKQENPFEKIQPAFRSSDAGPLRLPASAAQQRLWLVDQLEGSGGAYHIRIEWKLLGELHLQALQEALNEMVRRHEILRTTFFNEEGVPKQEIHPEAQFMLKTFDLTACEDRECETKLKIHRAEMAQEKFELSVGPLIRGRLLRLGAGTFTLIIAMHHIIFDGWSMDVFNRELEKLYEAFRQGRGSPLIPPSIQYADYAQWQRAWLQSGVLETQLGYWRTRLEGAPTHLDLPTDRPPRGLQISRGDIVKFSIDGSIGAQLKAFAQYNKMTVFMVLYAAWAILLSRLSGQEDVVIGTPVANRQRPELEKLLGFFVNTLILRVQVHDHLPVRELLQRAKESALGAYEHQDVPFDQLVEALQPQRSQGRNPFFQVMLVLQNTSDVGDLQLPGLTVVREEERDEPAKFELLLSLLERGDSIEGTVSYVADLYARETIERWMESFRFLLVQVMHGLQGRVGDLSVVPPNQRKVIESFNPARTAMPSSDALHVLFEAQVARTPHVVAVSYESHSITYAELNAKANQLARYLRDKGVGPDRLVALCVERGIEMVIGLLGVWKAGGAYVPLDPGYPLARLSYMIHDAAPEVLLIEERLRSTLPQVRCAVVALDKDWEHIAKHPSGNLESQSVGVDADHLAYVIYTSGSTGNPKGVMIEHGSVVNLWHGLEPLYAQPACQRPALNASFNFDASVQQFVQLLSGRTLVLIPERFRRDASMLLEFVKEQRIDAIDCTPSQLRSWIDAGVLDGATSLLTVLVGGEAIDPELWDRLAGCAEIAIHNVYGPTECTVDATMASLMGTTAGPNIGRPMCNRRVYIVDRNAQRVPIGVAGEIFIGGAGLARGYWHRPELTQERFITDAATSDSTARVYKTGDVGRWRADGTIEYLGRNDNQVKVRGHRIELGEIEAQLSRHARVKDAVVVALDFAGEPRLVAYVTSGEGPDADSTPSADELRKHLKASLPDHMVPSAFVPLDHMPLTPNGKVDRQALPTPTIAAYSSRQYEAPQGTIEKVLADIWQSLLSVERIGRNDNFFDLGGHSLLAVKALFQVNQAFGCTLTANDAYRSPTIQDLAARVRGGAATEEIIDLSKEAALSDEIVALPGNPQVPAEAILLTGATGFVGRFVLAQLVRDTDAIIYCLVRAQSGNEASSRLRGTLRKWGLWHRGFERRVVAIPADLRLVRFGMDESIYQMLCEKVDSIFHCAASMNHLETYAMAKRANVGSAHELLVIAARGKPKLINYVSTLSIFNAPAVGESRVIDESTWIDRETHSSASGYAASKWVADKIFVTAGSRGIHCNIFRVGLVWADTKQGRFDELQNVYRILKSCLLSGCGIKNYRFGMAPTPVDHVASAIVSLAGGHPNGQGVFHISSPSQTSEGIFERCNETAGLSLQLMGHYEWIREIKRLHELGRTLPSVPLVEFAFSMDEEQFARHEQNLNSRIVSFDCTRTYRALEATGITAPVLNDELLQVCVEGMLSTDVELQVPNAYRPVDGYARRH